MTLSFFLACTAVLVALNAFVLNTEHGRDILHDLAQKPPGL